MLAFWTSVGGILSSDPYLGEAWEGYGQRLRKECGVASAEPAFFIAIASM